MNKDKSYYITSACYVYPATVPVVCASSILHGTAPTNPVVELNEHEYYDHYANWWCYEMQLFNIGSLYDLVSAIDVQDGHSTHLRVPVECAHVTAATEPVAPQAIPLAKNSTPVHRAIAVTQ